MAKSRQKASLRKERSEVKRATAGFESARAAALQPVAQVQGRAFSISGMISPMPSATSELRLRAKIGTPASDFLILDDFGDFPRGGITKPLE